MTTPSLAARLRELQLAAEQEATGNELGTNSPATFTASGRLVSCVMHNLPAILDAMESIPPKPEDGVRLVWLRKTIDAPPLVLENEALAPRAVGE